MPFTNIFPTFTRTDLDVIPGAVAVAFEIEVGDGEVDACSWVYGDRPDADGVVVVRLRVVGRRQRTSVRRELTAAR